MIALKPTRRLIVAYLCIALCSLSHAEDAVPPAYRLVADDYGVPATLFYAIALTESGKRIESKDCRRPWPWTLNIAGRPRYFSTRWQAWLALDQSLQSGQQSVDIGLMQVNWRFHGERLGNSWLALEPNHNLAVGAEILKNCYAKRRDWWASVGCYHAPMDSERAKRYQARVAAHWRELTGVD
jgi:soluble lytic murein transglycosylase-like protein